MRNDLNRIQTGVIRQDGGHLRDAILFGIEQEPLRSIRQPSDQGLVVGNTAVEEDEVRGHGLRTGLVPLHHGDLLLFMVN